VSRAHAIRVGVVACVVAVAAAALLRMDETMGLFDFRADRNASLAYLEREYGDRGWAPDRRVVEDARLRMPEDATYAIVLGARRDDLIGVVAADFLRYFLLPRREVDAGSGDAEWAFCYACDPTQLQGRFDQLSTGRDGFSFGRLRE
jgi:hypothetical protein